MLAMAALRQRRWFLKTIPYPFYEVPSGRKEAKRTVSVRRQKIRKTDEEPDEAIQARLYEASVEHDARRRAELLAEIQLLQIQLGLLYRDQVRKELDRQERELADIMIMLLMEV